MREFHGGSSVRPDPVTPTIQAEFVESEWIRLTTRQVVAMIPYLNGVITAFSGKGIYFSPDGQNLGGGGNTTRVIAASPPRALFQPTVTDGDVEGAVYGAIFVDFASFVGLDFAASSYFKANAITFGQYREFINNRHPDHSAALEQVRSFWGL